MTTQLTEADSFSVIEPFIAREPTNPNWKLLGSAQLIEGCLQLTSAEGHKAGAALLDVPFNSERGVSVEFDYAVDGEQGPLGQGDGFSVFLIDGAQTTDVGRAGANLGYVGVKHGYAGIGFDNFGGFASAQVGAGGSSGVGPQPNILAVRGATSTDHKLLTSNRVPGGFRGGWDAKNHVEVTIVNGVLSVRCSSAADARGAVMLDKFDLKSAAGQARMPSTLKLGLSAGTADSWASHRIRNLKVRQASQPIDAIIGQHRPVTTRPGAQWLYPAVRLANADNHTLGAEPVTITVPPGLRFLEDSAAFIRQVDEPAEHIVPGKRSPDQRTITLPNVPFELAPGTWAVIFAALEVAPEAVPGVYPVLFEVGSPVIIEASSDVTVVTA
ncbi:hypothetical protein ABZ471_47005 [Streptomyces sp. NPDC005728]|uniref:lectin-like domain-containing protein n=1 Tax=Streptomyces sp. NPDC005728 TaxID=3157054 RepID=UPI0033EE92F1